MYNYFHDFKKILFSFDGYSPPFLIVCIFSLLFSDSVFIAKGDLICFIDFFQTPALKNVLSVGVFF